jgi:hypothetical protein
MRDIPIDETAIVLMSMAVFVFRDRIVDYAQHRLLSDPLFRALLLFCFLGLDIPSDFIEQFLIVISNLTKVSSVLVREGHQL